MLRDNLGSISLVTDANGANPIIAMYKAWGEVRHSSASLPTKYQFTGQFSHASEFGLYFCNARWVDVSLGRFAQADVITLSAILIPAVTGRAMMSLTVNMGSKPQF